MKNKLRYCNIRFVFQTKWKLSIFLHLKTEFHCFYVMSVFRNVSVVAAMLPVTAKLNVLLRSEWWNTWELRHSLGKELKVMTIVPLKNIFYSAITRLILNFSFLTTNNKNFKVTLMESLLINRDHTPLNDNKQFLSLELFDS